MRSSEDFLTLTLTRTRKPSWVFKYDKDTGRYIHKTKKGSTYTIFSMFCCGSVLMGKAFWIGRSTQDCAGWITCEDHIGAEAIWFQDGSAYFFKKGLRRGEQRD